MNQGYSVETGREQVVDRLVRHALIDRLLHWLTAVCVIVLLATAFLPILGIDFAWVAIHWVTGLVLTVSVAAHIVRTLFQTAWFDVDWKTRSW